jgi:N-acyl-D-aspartate/D-glutamate deacylase
MRRPIASILVCVVLASACGGGVYDVVIQGGRVMDPESGLDAVMNVGIREGRIEAITEEAMTGVRTIDASGLVVTAGFIDLHQHAQDEQAYALTVADGVTSTLELEVGTNNVAAWYTARERGQVLNYGVSIGHVPVRMAVMGDPGGFLPTGPGGYEAASDTQVAEMARRIQEGLEQGAVAVGFGTAYTPAATMAEVETLFRIAADHGAAAHIHTRGGLTGLTETIETAARANVPLHVVHANSSGGSRTAEFLEIIRRARAEGQDVTTEAYPYGAGMTAIESALFNSWESWSDDRFNTHQWVGTGERLTRETLGRYRAIGGMIISHSRTEEMTLAAIANPLTMIASDGFMENGRGHPRTSGTYAKVLGRYVREQGVIDLMDALRRMSLEPARRLEGRVPSMRAKGRVRVGADADITIFDPETVIDRSTYMDATITSEGIEYVLVNGVPVINAGELVAGARPGRPIRAIRADQ